MNDDIEQVLQRLTPRGAMADLRPRVLATVVAELRADTTSPWLRRSALVMAASIVLGIGLNIWATKASERRLAQLFGPPPVSQRAMEIAKDIERITDAQTGQWVYRQLTAGRENRDARADYARYIATVNRLIKELQTVSRDSYHETPEKDIEMDRDRAGRTGGHRTTGQRLVRLDYRYTA